MSLQTREGRREIVIPGRPIEVFLASEEGHETGTLLALGVQPEAIVSEAAEPEQNAPKKTFVPASSPIETAKLFSDFYVNLPNLVEKNVPAFIAKVLGRFEETAHFRNEIRDLRALGLLSADLLQSPGHRPYGNLPARGQRGP